MNSKKGTSASREIVQQIKFQIEFIIVASMGIPRYPHSLNVKGN